jgi:hypothetical protein
MYISRPKPKSEESEEPDCIIIVIEDPDQPVDNAPPAEGIEAPLAGKLQLKPSLSIGDALPAVVINERTLVFRMDSRTLWTRYSLGMINYSVSSFGGLDSTPHVEKNLARAAAAIGDFFIPYYGIKAGTKIGSLLTVIANNGTKVVESIKNKRDIAAYETIWVKQIDELATYLNELNPSQYPVDLISEQFISLVTAWATDFKARYNTDFVTDSVTLDSILKIAVSGIPNHVNKGYSSIADILSRGIIAQFPLSFVE